MDSVKFFVQSQLPAYLKSLPVPSTVGGFAQLTGDEWIRLLPLVGFVTILLYLVVANILDLGGSKKEATPEKGEGGAGGLINLSIDKEKDKVATAVDMDDLGEKTVYCRCWRSKKFPLCDGTHNKHNKDTGDNVGPLIVKRKEPEKTE